jgi:hypothetical protein
MAVYFPYYNVDFGFRVFSGKGVDQVFAGHQTMPSIDFVGEKGQAVCRPKRQMERNGLQYRDDEP